MKRKILILTLLFFFALGAGSASAFSFTELKAKITNSTIGQNLLLVSRSLRKLPDIVFLPYLLGKSDLPLIDIRMSKSDIDFLNDSLPKDSPFTGISFEEERPYTKVDFKSGDYEARVDIKYAGTVSNNWNSYKKSYKIVFPKKNLFHGIKSMELIIPSDRKYYSDFLNQYRAKKFGLLTPHMYLANVDINGENAGVYLAFEGWTKELTDADSISDNAVIYGADFTKERLFGGGSEPLKINGADLSAWSVYTDVKNKDTSGTEELETLLSILDNADDEDFEKLIPGIVDMDKFYGWDISFILAGKKYQGDFFQNFTMAYDPEFGKFEPLVWAGIKPWGDQNYYQFDTLPKRILSIAKFKNERNRRLKEYLEDEENFKDDMAFYDNLYKNTRSDFFRDFAKADTTFSFIKKAKSYREDFIDSYNSAKNVLNNEYSSSYPESNNGELILSGTFATLREEFSTKEEFLAKNYQFGRGEGNEVILYPGTHIFSKTAIVPEGLKLTIKPGATLYMAKGVSLFSYSPVIAEGTKEAPIKILPLNPAVSWGVLGVIGTKSNKSIIRNVEIRGGSGAHINGIVMTGTISFHKADVDIDGMVCEDSGNDDCLNTKNSKFEVRNSIFRNNSSDGWDSDVATDGSVAENNQFIDNGKGTGGDGLDISWSNILIKNNYMKGNEDKGISVGENSHPVITGNIIESNNIGIAVKDFSKVEITDTVLRDNNVGLSLYKKKETFGGGGAVLSGVKFEDNRKDYEADKFSKVIFK